MIANTLPGSVRDQAYELISSRLGRRPDVQDRLADFGGVTAVNLLIDLEDVFGIDLDVDETIPRGTVGELVSLVEHRTAQPWAMRRGPSRLYDISSERRARPARREAVAVPSEEAWRAVEAAERRASIGLGLVTVLALAGVYVAAVLWLHAAGIAL